MVIYSVQNLCWLMIGLGMKTCPLSIGDSDSNIPIGKSRTKSTRIQWNERGFGALLICFFSSFRHPSKLVSSGWGNSSAILHSDRVQGAWLTRTRPVWYCSYQPQITQIIDFFFPLVGWLIEGLGTAQKNNRQWFYRWYTSHRPKPVWPKGHCWYPWDFQDPIQWFASFAP